MADSLPGDRLPLVAAALAGIEEHRQGLTANDLAEAITAEQLFLEYQPKIDCRLGEVIGVEALVRWRHPVRGIIPPDHFLGLAEECALIHQLTDWVAASAARQGAAWHAHHLPLDVAVNISAKNLQNSDLPDQLAEHCRDAGIDCSVMTLELTETGATREAVQMMDVLTRLRLEGFRLSIDDFGTGYSSLLQLQQMPFTEVKIDRSFVIGMMNDDSCKIIVQHIIGLAGKLGLKSVAEGVEEAPALASLIASGCDLAQGYYLGRPMAADKVHLFISNRSVAQKILNISAFIDVGVVDKPLSKWRPGIWE